MNVDRSVRDHVRRHFEWIYEPGTGRIATASDAQIAPDGTRVAFTGTVVDDLAGDPSSRISLASDGEILVLTNGPGDDHHPRWSPDGASIAFLTDRLRSGVPQVVVMDVESRAVRDTPWIGGVVESLAWRADGRALLLGVAGLSADQGDRVGPGAEANAPSILSREPDGCRRQVWVHDIATSTSRAVGHADLNVWESHWCGDSRAVVVASSGWAEGSWFTCELFLLELDGASTTAMYRPAGQLARPVASPSGARVAVIDGVASDRGVVAGEIVMVDVETGTRCALDTAGVDVTDLEWLDEECVAFIGVRRLEAVAGMARRNSPAEFTWQSPVSCGRHIATASFGADGRMAVVQDDYRTYSRVTVIDRGAECADTSLAPAAISRLLEQSGTAEPVTWTSSDGAPIEGILCRPAGDGPFPLILHVHGGPIGVTTNAWNMGNDTTRLLVSRGFAVLHPNPRGSYGRGQAFASAVVGDMGGADRDDLLAGVDAMVQRRVADPRRIGVAGTSYGGFMAAWLPAHTDRFRGAVSMSPVSDWRSLFYTSNIPEFVQLFLASVPAPNAGGPDDTPSPFTVATHNGTPTLIVAGRQDLCTPVEQARRLHSALSMAGTRSELVVYPDEAHGVRGVASMMDLCCRVITWFEETLSPIENRPP